MIVLNFLYKAVKIYLKIAGIILCLNLFPAAAGKFILTFSIYRLGQFIYRKVKDKSGKQKLVKEKVLRNPQANDLSFEQKIVKKTEIKAIFNEPLSNMLQ